MHEEAKQTTWRVHAFEERALHCDVISESPEQAEKLLKEAWEADNWTEHDSYVESGPVRCETPCWGLDVYHDKTRKLIPSDRKMGESAKEHYRIKEKVRAR